MTFVIVGVFIIVVGFLIWRSKQNIDPAEQACAREIGDLLGSDPNAELQSIAEVFDRHGISAPRCKNVGRMVMPQLARRGLCPDNARLAMNRVRAAYSKVSQH